MNTKLINLIVILLFTTHLTLYVYGSTVYPWLEDDDPYDHAIAVNYISETLNFIQPEPFFAHYLTPYPPFYGIVMTVLYKLSGLSIPMTLKIFNAIMISLTIPLFFIWLKRLVNENTALYSTIILSVVPAYMSHFIWAQTLSMLLFFPALYFFDKYLKDENDKQKNKLLSILLIFGILIVQPSAALILFIMLGIYVISTKSLYGIDVLIISLILAFLIYWGPMIYIYSYETVIKQLGLSVAFVTDKNSDTGGGLIYTIDDFINAPLASKIDQPIGFGICVVILTLIGLICLLLQRNNLTILLLLWFVFCLVGVEGNALPCKMMPHRFWVFLSIPVAIIGGIGLQFIIERLPQYSTIIKIVFIVGLLVGSLYPKFVVETTQWPPGTSWSSNEQISGYANLKQTTKDVYVYGMCSNPSMIIGMEMKGWPWIWETRNYRNISITDTNDNNYNFLTKYGYRYLIIDSSCLTLYNQTVIQTKINMLLDDKRFEYDNTRSNSGFVVFRIIYTIRQY